jgi:hypothetical protein
MGKKMKKKWKNKIKKNEKKEKVKMKSPELEVTSEGVPLGERKRNRKLCNIRLSRDF